jgi:hypothetical protein
MNKIYQVLYAFKALIIPFIWLLSSPFQKPVNYPFLRVYAITNLHSLICRNAFLIIPCARLRYIILPHIMKYTASRLSEGNKLFPAQIIVEPTGITIKIPGLFSGDETSVAYDSISAVEIDTPLIGYSTIRFYHNGNKVEAHGFSKSDAKEIKAAIENGRGKARS